MEVAFPSLLLLTTFNSCSAISIVKPTRCTTVSNLFYFGFNDTLHVSGGLSVHRQEFKTVHTATGICQTDTAVCLLAGTRIGASSWFYYRNITMHGPMNVKAAVHLKIDLLQYRTAIQGHVKILPDAWFTWFTSSHVEAITGTPFYPQLYDTCGFELEILTNILCVYCYFVRNKS